MKTRFLGIITFSVTILSLGAMFIPEVFGWCPENEDWPDAPCYAAAY